ncbi:hypothetical protein DPMN_122664 [Dreissena polymorpha]|uniref:Uncharacterized protein n=1 Tax=Dreissena polymorpha TaxID=45954 RepID=A0A9D4GPU2_DREPO|nr:hypothetical protein DPMN_122664 [Dreissena polymorpha]
MDYETSSDDADVIRQCSMAAARASASSHVARQDDRINWLLGSPQDIEDQEMKVKSEEEAMEEGGVEGSPHDIKQQEMKEKAEEGGEEEESSKTQLDC